MTLNVLTEKKKKVSGSKKFWIIVAAIAVIGIAWFVVTQLLPLYGFNVIETLEEKYTDSIKVSLDDGVNLNLLFDGPIKSVYKEDFNGEPNRHSKIIDIPGEGEFWVFDPPTNVKVDEYKLVISACPDVAGEKLFVVVMAERVKLPAEKRLYILAVSCEDTKEMEVIYYVID